MVYWLESLPPGFDSRPGASPQCGLRGSRSLCNTLQIKYMYNPRPRWAVNLKKKNIYIYIYLRIQQLLVSEAM